MLQVELSTLVRRPRTWLLAVLALVLPALFLAGMRGNANPPAQTQDPVGYLSAARHGWALVVAPLLFGSPIFLPIVVAVVAGTAIGADAASGYLRYLLVRPVARHRVYLTKLAAALVFCAGLTVLLLLLGTVAAVALPHPAGPALTTVDTNRSIVALDPGGWLLRVAAAGGYLMLWLSALAAIGVLAGLLTRSAVGGVGLAIGYHLVATVLTQLTSLRAIHPALLPYWLGRWTTVAQTHPHWASLAEGAACAGGYLVAATLIGLVRLRRQDVTA